jgi:hypothetical protein
VSGELIVAEVVGYRGPQGQTITEDIKMFKRNGMFKSTGRATLLAAVAAMTVSAVAPTGAMAAPAAKSQASTHHGMSDATDFSSARRRHYRGGGNAAGLAAFGAVVGTIGAIAASQSRRDYYDSYNYYDGGPAYYGGGGYYGGPYRGYGGGHGYDNSRRMTW